MAVTRFSLAVDRPKRNSNEQGADFPTIVAFDKQAENLCRYMDKGRQIAVVGRIQTGSYKDKDGKTVYTTEVVADRIEFIGSDKREPAEKPVEYGRFDSVSDGIPF